MIQIVPQLKVLVRKVAFSPNVAGRKLYDQAAGPSPSNTQYGWVRGA